MEELEAIESLIGEIHQAVQAARSDDQAGWIEVITDVLSDDEGVHGRDPTLPGDPFDAMRPTWLQLKAGLGRPCDAHLVQPVLQRRAQVVRPYPCTGS